MHSYLIVSQDKNQSLDHANKLSPFPLNPHLPDCLLLDQPETLGIDTVRQLKSFLSKKPYLKSHKLVFIKYAHLLTTPAQNALLKTLEEPPENSLIILTTPNDELLLPTIVSRCQVIRIKSKSKPKLEETELTTILNRIKKANPGEKITLASQYAYPKTKAKEFLKLLVSYFRNFLYKNPSRIVLTNLKLSQKSLDRLEKNVDPRLTLEHLFLHLK